MQANLSEIMKALAEIFNSPAARAETYAMACAFLEIDRRMKADGSVRQDRAWWAARLGCELEKEGRPAKQWNRECVFLRAFRAKAPLPKPSGFSDGDVWATQQHGGARR